MTPRRPFPILPPPRTTSAEPVGWVVLRGAADTMVPSKNSSRATQVHPTSVLHLCNLRNLWIFFLFFALLPLPACGKKGPPMPPKAVLPGQVCDLSATLADGKVGLTWRSGPCEPGERAARFRVFRCSRRIKGEPCQDCPCSWSEAALLENSPPERTPELMRYVDFVEPGYEYRYRVTPLGPRGTPGLDSETVRVAWPLDEGER